MLWLVKLAAFAATLPVVLALAVGARRLAVGRTDEADRPALALLQVGTLTAAGALITIAVTGLKYLHILSEGTRAAFP